VLGTSSKLVSNNDAIMDCADRAVQLVLDSSVDYAENQVAFGALQLMGQLGIVPTLDNLDGLEKVRKLFVPELLNCFYKRMLLL